MTTLTSFCLLIVLMLPLLLAGGSVWFRFTQLDGFDINNPRSQAEMLSGAGQRIVYAQYNAWEALVAFLVSLFAATQAGVGEDTIQSAALIFVVARIAHPIFYVANIAPLRVLSFAAAIGACLWLMVSALM